MKRFFGWMALIVPIIVLYPAVALMEAAMGIKKYGKISFERAAGIAFFILGSIELIVAFVLFVYPPWWTWYYTWAWVWIGSGVAFVALVFMLSFLDDWLQARRSRRTQ